MNEREPWERLDVVREGAKNHGSDQTVTADVFCDQSQGQASVQIRARGQVERKHRDVVIHEFDVRRAQTAQACTFGARFKGTYVRTLASDLCRVSDDRSLDGAQTHENRGEFDVEDAWTIDQLAEACGEDPAKFQRNVRIYRLQIRLAH